jgi:hypothetical protein
LKRRVSFQHAQLPPAYNEVRQEINSRQHIPAIAGTLSFSHFLVLWIKSQAAVPFFHPWILHAYRLLNKHLAA